MNRHEVNKVLPALEGGLFWNLSEDDDWHIRLSLCDKNFLGFSRTLESVYVVTESRQFATIPGLTADRLVKAANNCLANYNKRKQTIQGRHEVLGYYNGTS